VTTVGREAKILYFDGDFEYQTPGDHVKCSVTGNKIHLAQLQYWSVDRQEAYTSAQMGFIRHSRYD
jgi:hypothetical protein